MYHSLAQCNSIFRKNEEIFRFLSHIISAAKLGVGIYAKSASGSHFCSVFVRVFRVVSPIEILADIRQSNKN
jgi:hypothetical protein